MEEGGKEGERRGGGGEGRARGEKYRLSVE